MNAVTMVTVEIDPSACSALVVGAYVDLAFGSEAGD